MGEKHVFLVYFPKPTSPTIPIAYMFGTLLLASVEFIWLVIIERSIFSNENFLETWYVADAKSVWSWRKIVEISAEFLCR